MNALGFALASHCNHGCAPFERCILHMGEDRHLQARDRVRSRKACTSMWSKTCYVLEEHLCRSIEVIE